MNLNKTQPESFTGPLGTLFVISAPSGAGKTSLVKALLDTVPNLEVSVSYTTREKRQGEEHQLHYHFIDVEKFQNMVSQNAFLEHANVFQNYYGTSEQKVLERLADNKDIILEIDWQGAAQVRQRFPQCVTIFVLPPSKQVLVDRLESRGLDSQETINLRAQEAVNEISHFDEFDYIVVNDQFDVALSDLTSIVGCARLTKRRQKVVLAPLIGDLLE